MPTALTAVLRRAAAGGRFAVAATACGGRP